MSNIIDSIQISGVTYTISGQSSGANAVEVTQAEYDALVTGGTVDPNAFYIITDATEVDISQYWTSAQTQSAINQSVSGKQDTLVSSVNIKTINNESILGEGNITIEGGGGSGITSGEVQTMIDESISGKTNQNDNLFTIRTNVIETVVIAGGANLRIIFAFDIIQNNQIVLSTDTVNDKSSLLSALAALGFDNKIYDIRGVNYANDTSNTSYFGEFLGHKCYAVLMSYVPDFGSITIGLKRNNVYYTLDSVGSGKYDYNYLSNKPTIPTVPTSNTAFTNDAGYITIDAISGKVDTSTYNTYTAATDTALASKQTTLTAGTGISIIDNVISATGGGGGGGKAIEAGRGISVTTGETADTVSFNLPISATTLGLECFDSFNSNSKTGNSSTNNNIVVGSFNTIGGNGQRRGFNNNFIFGNNNKIIDNNYQYDNSSVGNIICGYGNIITGESNSYTSIFGYYNKSYKGNQTLFGYQNKSINKYETSFGFCNNSVSASTTFGDSGNTLFSVGNGTADNARHNAFEIRQNGDIYLSSGGTDIKLQDHLGGGGSSYTAGDGIDITNDVISVTGKVDTSAITTSVTSSSTDSQVPSAKAVNDKLGGLSIVKMTQSEYDALATKDSNTLYVING